MYELPASASVTPPTDATVQYRAVQLRPQLDSGGPGAGAVRSASGSCEICRGTCLAVSTWHLLHYSTCQVRWLSPMTSVYLTAAAAVEGCTAL